MKMNKLISIILLIALLTSPVAALAEFLPVNPGMPVNPVATATPAPVCSHSWTVVYRNEPTCDEYGDETLQCAKCGDWGDRSIDPLGHSWKWTVETKANCQEGGRENGVCTRCYITTERDTALGGHDYNWTVAKAASCQESGSRRGKCRVCGKTTSETIKKAAHSFSAWAITVPAGENTAGERSRTCSVCAYTETEAFYPEGTLIPGGENDPEIVTALQQALTEAGYDCGEADGAFGKQTEDALKAYQTDTGREPDGIAWPSILIELGVIKSSLIEITDVVEPVGLEPYSTSAKVITEGFRLAAGKTVRWYFRNMEMREGESFIPGEIYTVKILVKGDVEDASVLRATVNGREAGVSVLAGIITVSCDIPCPEMELGPVERMMSLPPLPYSVDITSLDIPVPVNNKTADYSAEISGNTAKLFGIPAGGITWKYNTQRIGGYFKDVAERDGKFPNNAQIYWAEITVVPHADFDAEKYILYATVNGEEAAIKESESVPGAYMVRKRFQFDVDKIEVTGLEKPFPGNKLDWNVNVRMHVAGTDNWFECTQEVDSYAHTNYLSLTEYFYEPGKHVYTERSSYSAEIRLNSMGYYFANGIEVTFDGKPIDFEIRNDQICFAVSSRCEEQEIDKLTLTVSDPHEGNSPRRVDNHAQLTANGKLVESKLDLEYISWYDSDTGERWAWYKVFTKDYHYKVEAELNPPEGFVFSKNLSATVNGNPAEAFYYNGDRILVSYDFTPEAQEITSVRLVTGIEIGAAPAAPQAEGSTASGLIANPAVSSWKWTDADSGKALPADAVFEEGHSYRLEVTLAAPMDFVFGEDIPVVFDGNIETAPAGASGKAEMTLSTVFAPLEKPVIEIASINMTVEEPAAGAAPSYKETFTARAVTGESVKNLSLETIQWRDMTNGEVKVPESGFEAGHSYRVRADFMAWEGYDFADGFKAYVNGKAADVSVNTGAIRARYVDFTFDVPAEITEIQKLYFDNISEPHPGEMPYTSVLVTATDINGNPAEVRLIRGDWSSTEDKKFTGNAGTFVDGMMYTLTLQVESGKANVFPEGMVLTSVNGNSAGPRSTSAGTKASLSFNFRCQPENITYISNVNAGITVPVDGQTPDFSPILSATDTQGNSVPVYFIEMSWTDVTDNRTLGENDVFIGGHSYKLYIRANFDPATELSMFDFSTSLNGALYASHSSAKLLNDKAVSLDYELNCEAVPAADVIKNLYIDAVVPAAGAAPDMNPALRANCEDGSAGVVSLSSVAWTDVTDVANLIPLTAESSFEAGHQYRMNVSAAAGEGMSFRGDAPAIFNGSYVGLKLENENTLGSAFNIFTVEAAAPETPETPGTTAEPEVPTDGSDASAGSEEDMKQPQDPEASAEPEIPTDGSDAAAGSEEDMKQPENTEAPAPIEPEPVVPELPEPTKAPVVPELPVPTEAPVVPELPVPTEQPGTSEKSDAGNTEQPEDTEKEDKAPASSAGGALSFRLTIPDTIVDETVTRSAYDNALDLYQAQLSGRTDEAASKLAKDWFEGCGNSIVYVPDMKDRGLYDVFESLFTADKPIDDVKILYGPEGMQSEYEILALLHTEPSDKDYALCNMSDLSLPGIMDMYSVYLSSMALRSSGTAAEGDELLSIVVWNADPLSDWRMVVAKKL